MKSLWSSDYSNKCRFRELICLAVTITSQSSTLDQNISWWASKTGWPPSSLTSLAASFTAITVPCGPQLNIPTFLSWNEQINVKPSFFYWRPTRGLPTCSQMGLNEYLTLLVLAWPQAPRIFRFGTPSCRQQGITNNCSVNATQMTKITWILGPMLTQCVCMHRRELYRTLRILLPCIYLEKMFFMTS